MITIVDSGVANVGSVANMLQRVGARARVSKRPEEIGSAERLILPGVGAFDGAIEAWSRSGLADALQEALLARAVPCLGICLGMQVMARESEEGMLPGLGLIDARVVRFCPTTASMKVPHMGWNFVRPVRKSRLFTDLEDGARFYFVHSYHVVCREERDILARADYGGSFTCAIERNNLAGVQFHPEKSHRFGMRLLANFLAWNP